MALCMLAIVRNSPSSYQSDNNSQKERKSSISVAKNRAFVEEILEKLSYEVVRHELATLLITYV